jgi:serine/threonine-protein kinase HipA
VIDPIHLPVLDDAVYIAPRYQGLIDVLRDITPDSWGKVLIQREHGLGRHAHDFDYLLHTGNADRWGALAISAHATPSIAHISSPKLPKLKELLLELQLMASRQPAQYPAIRKSLIKTLSSGGARPKTTVQDGERYWLVKPTIASDDINTSLFEHACMRFGRSLGLNVSFTDLYQDQGTTAVMVERFDRIGERRFLVLSGATLLSTEYPSANDRDSGANARWSYPLLAESLRAIGCPLEDLKELFLRMVFNALLGNDDDHPRNHAAMWNQAQHSWRLSPAFDIVPNMNATTRLSMQLSRHRFDISDEAILGDWQFFGFQTRDAARQCMLSFLGKAIENNQAFYDFGLSEMEAEFMTARVTSTAKAIAGFHS